MSWVVLLSSGILMTASTEPPGGKKKGEAEPPPVPVVVAEAKRRDVPVYLTGLGNVTPLANVTVKSRVDGQLMRVLFVEGQAVTRGSLIAEIDARPFEAQLLAAEGQLSRDRALLENSRRDLERYQLLTAQDSIARQQYDTQKSLVQQNQGNVEADLAQSETAKLQIAYSRIVAPIDGRVGLRLVDPGNIVHASDATGLVVITQVRPIAVLFAIAEDNLPPVAEKLRGGEHPPVDAFDREFVRRIATGALFTMDNQIDPNTGTVRLKAIFDNADEVLFPNQFVNARLLVGVVRDATVVPTAALQRTSQRVFVYVVRPDGIAEVRDVNPGPADGDETSVESGLSAGERVVVEGTDRVRQGVRAAPRAGDAGVEGGAR